MNHLGRIVAWMGKISVDYGDRRRSIEINRRTYTEPLQPLVRGVVTRERVVTRVGGVVTTPQSELHPQQGCYKGVVAVVSPPLSHRCVLQGGCSGGFIPSLSSWLLSLSPQLRNESFKCPEVRHGPAFCAPPAPDARRPLPSASAHHLTRHCARLTAASTALSPPTGMATSTSSSS